MCIILKMCFCFSLYISHTLSYYRLIANVGVKLYMSCCCLLAGHVLFVADLSVDFVLSVYSFFSDSTLFYIMYCTVKMFTNTCSRLVKLPSFRYRFYAF